MVPITLIAEFFLYSVGLGISGFSFLADSRQTGAGFLKLCAGLSAAALALAAIAHGMYAAFNSPQAVLYYVAISASLLTYVFHKDKKSVLMWMLYALQVSSLLWLLFKAQNNYMTAFIFFLSSALYLGIITYAMVMGHWYLVTPKLSERPLKTAIILMWMVLFFKLGMTTWSVVENPQMFAVGTRQRAGYAFNWLMLLMRVVWGYLVIGGMSIFGWKLIKMRSIQSATGILYAMTFFVFVGEIVSTYLYYRYGIII